MTLPPEIIENILINCDGNTLLNARKVDPKWKSIVDYLTQKTKIWQWCCEEEIPGNQLIEYLQKYKANDDQKWLHIYINWCSFENLDDVVCDIILSPVDVPRISCLAISGEYIAIGSQDGRIRIFTSNWKMIYKARILAVRINSITFIESDEPEPEINLCLVIAFNRGLHIFHFDGMEKDHQEILDVQSHSVYKNYICYEKLGGRLTISKIISRHGKKELSEIWFSRIYSPSCLSCMKMWDGVCTFLINNEVKTIQYGAEDATPMDIMEKKTRIRYNSPLVENQNTQILRDDIIIRLCKNEDNLKCDFIEFFLLGELEKYSKKMFSTWEIFKSYITCIFLYGNTLILGMDIGYLYIYHVSCWKNLDLRNYSHRVIIGKHPIINIVVKETPTERRFYVSSKFNIHEVTGFLPNIYV